MHFRIINKLNKSVRQTFCVLMSQNIKEAFITCISCIMGNDFFTELFCLNQSVPTLL